MYDYIKPILEAVNSALTKNDNDESNFQSMVFPVVAATAIGLTAFAIFKMGSNKNSLSSKIERDLTNITETVEPKYKFADAIEIDFLKSDGLSVDEMKGPRPTYN